MSGDKKRKVDEDESVEFSFPLKISGETKKRLAMASEVFSTQFERIRNGNDYMEIKITDCSKDSFCTLIKIIGGEVELKSVLDGVGISVLMELLYLVDKYQIEKKVLDPSEIRGHIQYHFVINESNLLTCIKNFLKWKDVTIFKDIYENRKNVCAKVFHMCVNKYNMMLEVAEIDDSELKLRCLDELAEFERDYKLCGNCREVNEDCWDMREESFNPHRIRDYYLGKRIMLKKDRSQGSKIEAIGEVISRNLPLRMKHADGFIKEYAAKDLHNIQFCC